MELRTGARSSSGVVKEIGLTLMLLSKCMKLSALLIIFVGSLVDMRVCESNLRMPHAPI